MLDDFPDRMHLEKIRAALWRGKEFGQAAVLEIGGYAAQPLAGRQQARAQGLSRAETVAWLNLAPRTLRFWEQL